MRRIAITGASGFVGTNLTNHFKKNGEEVVAIHREDLKNLEKLTDKVNGCEVVINLAGANIISRWTDSYKKTLYSSRIDTTTAIIAAFKKAKQKPKLLISTSAVGIYTNDKEHTENDYKYEDNFLANLCKDWETEALKAKELGIRTAIFRFGIILGDNGGALEKMLTPFKLGFGGTIGDGEQPFSFIHIDDLLSGYDFVIQNEQLDGVFNLTTPHPTTNKGLTKALGKTLHRPTILPVPVFVLNLIFSDGAQVLSDGQRVVPQKLLDNGFEFKHKDIETTIEHILG